MSSTEASKPLFRLFKNSRKKYETVKYETLNDGKKRVPTFDCSRFHSDQFAKFLLPKIRTLIKLMGWSKRDLCDELEQELITANHSKLDQAFRKSGIDPDDGNDDDLEEQFDTLMVYFLDKIDGRNNAGNIVLNSCKPPALSFDDALDKYGDQMDCKPSDVLGRILTTRKLTLKTLAIAEGTEPTDETNKRDYFFIFNEEARHWFENEYREGGPYENHTMDEIAAGMDVYFKKQIDTIKKYANRNRGKKRKYNDEDDKDDEATKKNQGQSKQGNNNGGGGKAGRKGGRYHSSHAGKNRNGHNNNDGQRNGDSNNKTSLNLCNGNGPKNRCKLAWCNRHQPANHTNEECTWQQRGKTGPDWSGRDSQRQSGGQGHGRGGYGSQRRGNNTNYTGQGNRGENNHGGDNYIATDGQRPNNNRSSRQVSFQLPPAPTDVHHIDGPPGGDRSNPYYRE